MMGKPDTVGVGNWTGNGVARGNGRLEALFHADAEGLKSTLIQKPCKGAIFQKTVQHQSMSDAPLNGPGRFAKDQGSRQIIDEVDQARSRWLEVGQAADDWVSGATGAILNLEIESFLAREMPVEQGFGNAGGFG